MKPLYEMQDIRSDLLNVERSIYQRAKHEDKITRIVADWDERIANEPKVSYRDGKYYVFDGQHTILAREQLNNDEPIEILCKVYKGLSAQDEALLFAKQTGISSKPSSGERLRANIFGNEQDAIDFCEATEKSGLSIDFNGTRHKMHLACVSTALNAYRKIGKEHYAEAICIIADAWRGEADSLRHEIIKAVTEFVELYYGLYDRDVLVKALRSKKPINIRNKIISDFDRPNNIRYAYQIWEVYNTASKKRLPKIKAGGSN